MPRVLFLQNGDQDAPGLFAQVLREQGAEVEIIHAWQEEAVPATAEGWDGIAIGGGAMSAYELDEFPFLRDESLLIRAAREQGVPMFGMCLGAQLIAGACGGRVFANRQKEIGFYDLQFTPAAAADPLWRDHTAGIRPVHWHGDTFSLPPQAVLLASTEVTPNQLFSLDGRHYGLQFHLEMDAEILGTMIDSDEVALAREGVAPDEFRQAAKTALPAVEPVARAVFGRWLKLLK